VTFAPLRISSVYRRPRPKSLIVRTDCARRGIGEMLLRTTLARAARRNLGTLSALVLHENTAMLRLARKVGFEAHKSSGLVVELEFDLG
jgi:L-amino acid N-acyltransferase YncA